MCLIAFAIGMRDDCPMLIASNRDEYWDRPTLPLDSWSTPDGMVVYGGRDAQAGGTWLGFNAQGRVAMLTNASAYATATATATAPALVPATAPAPRSRGELALRWLQGAAITPDWQALVAAVDPGSTAGFNLVLGDQAGGAWLWLSNQPLMVPAPSAPLPLPAGWTGAALAPGLYGLSNAGLNTPWTKTLRLKAATLKALQQLGCCASMTHTLLQVLLDRSNAGTPEQAASCDPLVPLAAPFVHIPDARYGTRSSLIARQWVAAGQSGLELQEWTHTPDAAPGSQPGYRSISISEWGMPTSR